MQNWLTEDVQWLITPVAAVVVLVFGIWFVNKSFANRPNLKIYRQLAVLGLIIGTFLTFIAFSPIEDKSTIINILGLALTAVLGLSSTTFVSNAMAGLMLKSMGNFHTGDIIRVGEFFGGVRAKALLHTEIQGAERDIIHIPNLFLITNPVQVVDQKGTLISAEVSIGYDVHRVIVQQQLLQAAERAGLKEAFAHVTELGNFAVTYRVTGMLQDYGKLITKQHELKAAVLDTLHEQQIEIMTPSVMNQRPLPADQTAIPPITDPQTQKVDQGHAEKIMFDKSELAARINKLSQRKQRLLEEITTLKKDDAELKAMDIAWREQHVQDLENIIGNFDKELKTD
ncbi:MAG: mechanosensitive ion channel domain-containing protein [Pseudomonadota bacterium]